MGVARFLIVAPVLALGVLMTGTAARADDPHKGPPASSPPTFGRLPWLGVSMDDGSDLGVRVENVVRGSPAERGGVRAGDRIVEIDRKRVTAPAHVSRTVATHKVGDTVTLAIERTGNAIRAPIILGARPSSDELVRMHLVGAPAPPWGRITPLSGAPPSVASLRGKVAVIDFWASWCGPCRMMAPRLSTLKDRLGPQGLEVIGITTDPPEHAATFAERHQMRYAVVVDKDGDASRAYNIASLPTMILVDKKGIVRDVFVGFDPNGDVRLEGAVKKLLAEPPEPTAAPATAPTVLHVKSR